MMTPITRYRIVGIWAVTILAGVNCGFGGDDPRVAVPATDEITVLDPRVSSDGKPTPMVVSGMDGRPMIDIPPTVIVHNYYYTGDRDFRGPRLVGGPSIVVVSHPGTGERLYLDVQMLPGSPRVIYRKDQIDYEYGRDRIRIHFKGKHFGKESAKVSYVSGSDKVLRGDEDPLGKGLGKGGKTGPVRNAIANLDIALHKAGQAAVAPVANVVNATPLNALFRDPTEKIATERRNFEVQRAATQLEATQATIPTLR